MSAEFCFMAQLYDPTFQQKFQKKMNNWKGDHFGLVVPGKWGLDAALEWTLPVNFHL